MHHRESHVSVKILASAFEPSTSPRSLRASVNVIGFCIEQQAMRKRSGKNTHPEVLSEHSHDVAHCTCSLTRKTDVLVTWR